MSATNAPKRLGLVIVGALLASGLLLAACAVPDGPAGAGTSGDVVFRHPGVVVSHTQLQHAQQMVAAGKEPWKAAYQDLLKSRYASLGYSAHPADVVPCPFNAGPQSCLDERQDAIAAYTHALLWSVNGRTAHARKAVEIMDGWSAVMKRHEKDNAGLQAAWAGSTWARAAEIVHAGYPNWEKSKVDRFKEMLRTAYLPAVRAQVPTYNGNWELAMTDASLAIAVFLEDRAVFRESLKRFRTRAPAYFYLQKDGPHPPGPPHTAVDTADTVRTYWFNQGTYVDGIAQETCRNLKHVGYSLAASAHIAETAWHQGVDLYGEAGDRIRAALEFHAKYQLGEDVPRWLCGGTVERNMGPDLEVALHHYASRTGAQLPYTRRLVESTRPAGTDDLFVAWETLTHGEAALAPVVDAGSRDAPGADGAEAGGP
ncbi:alginate lyase family protein [Streptomyces sp. G-G2]|uniref:alginate lyase family protein n=1 Tax=Streptomyces sp. G-G2 TaxID=3046201 RepID=UPI0024BB7AEF|nr:alginate lyase family protein [Streptomyces sp. G-G2]MDJ0381809.1 alginate lyase family protein [Streptomyces sp. G-G2]